MSAAYTLRAVVYGTSNIVDQLQQIDVDPGLTEAMEAADSGIDSEFTSVVQQRPVITFSSTAIAKALAIVPIAGLVITAGTPLDFYFAKRAAGSTLDAANCIQVRVYLGVAYLVSIGASGTEAARAEFTCAAVWDGTNNPIKITKNVQLPAISPETTEIFGVGPVYVNGSVIDDIQSFNFETGYQLEYTQGSSNVYPKLAYLVSRAMALTAGILDLSQFDDSTGIGGLGVIRSGVTRFYLRKRAAGATYELNVTQVHIMFGVDEGAIRPGTFGGSNQQNATAQVKATPTWDGTGTPVTLDLTAAISGA